MKPPFLPSYILYFHARRQRLPALWMQWFYDVEGAE